MPRRVSLPAADELFRTTGGAGVQPSTPSAQPDGDSPSTAGRLPGSSTEPEVPTQHGSTEDGAGEVAAPAGEAAGPSAERPARSAPRRAMGPPVPGQAPERGRIRESVEPRRPASPTDRAGAAGAPGTRGRQTSSVTPRRGRTGSRRPSGRERHDEKITVYVSAEELMDLEHARLVLRGEHGLAVDRGRIVREAVAVVLADLETRGDASILVRRLRGR